MIQQQFSQLSIWVHYAHSENDIHRIGSGRVEAHMHRESLWSHTACCRMVFVIYRKALRYLSFSHLNDWMQLVFDRTVRNNLHVNLTVLYSWICLYIGFPLLRLSVTTCLSVCVSTKVTLRVVLFWLSVRFPLFCFFGLDTVLDSITLRHGSAEGLCWRVSHDLLFLSLHRQNKGTSLIVSFQCVCILCFLFFCCILFKRRLLFCWGKGFWSETRRVLTGLCDQLCRRLQSGLHLWVMQICLPLQNR